MALAGVEARAAEAAAEMAVVMVEAAARVVVTAEAVEMAVVVVKAAARGVVAAKVVEMAAMAELAELDSAP